MSDIPQGPGWWQASDDRWYPPDAQPGPDPAPPADATSWSPGYGAGHYGEAVPTAPASGASPYGQGYGPPAYGASPYGYAPAGPSVQGQATASMVLGILALVTFFCWFVAIVLALISLPLGLIAMNKISNGQAIPAGKGQALAGVICSGIALVLSIGVLVLIAGS